MNCIVCGNGMDAFTGGFNVCKKCGFLSYEENDRYQYTEEYYKAGNQLHGYIDYQKDEKNLLKTFKRRINRHIPIHQGQLLDVGCATGYGLQAANECGFTANGIDTCKWAVDRCLDKGYHAVTGDYLETEWPATFDVITAWDVIEHTDRPDKFMCRTNQLLNKQGFFVFTTPDASSILAKKLGKKWPMYHMAPEHLSIFTEKSIVMLLEKYGFRLISMSYAGKYVTAEHMMLRAKEYFLPSLPIISSNLSAYITPGDISTVAAIKVRGLNE